jgi:hypothetical protein
MVLGLFNDPFKQVFLNVIFRCEMFCASLGWRHRLSSDGEHFLVANPGRLSLKNGNHDQLRRHQALPANPHFTQDNQSNSVTLPFPFQNGHSDDAEFFVVLLRDDRDSLTSLLKHAKSSVFRFANCHFFLWNETNPGSQPMAAAFRLFV